jgi:hypothetical protein
MFDVVRTGFEPAAAWPVRLLCGGNLRYGIEILLAKLGLAVQEFRPQIMKLNVECILGVSERLLHRVLFDGFRRDPLQAGKLFNFQCRHS